MQARINYGILNGISIIKSDANTGQQRILALATDCPSINLMQEIFDKKKFFFLDLERLFYLV